jgi:RHS repeat-associated protein
MSSGAPSLRITSTDPAQVQSATDQDAFGRILNAVEYPATGGPWTTAYEYDLLNNLTKVTQASQQRNFKYDSLSRLREAENPETGKISFVYDDNGNVKEKKDGRSTSLNALIIDYDKLNRILKKSYPSTSAVSPDVHFTYDSDQRQPGDTNPNYPIGQLVRVRVGSPSTETNQTTFHRFDSLGRVEQATQRVDSKQYLTTYSYDFANQLRTLGYPKGWSLTYDYNPLGQLTTVSKGATVYASQMQYHPHGAPKQMTLGNGLISKWDFNTRLQLTKTQLGTTASANSVAEFGLIYDGTTCNGGANWVNNGNVVKQDIVVGGVTFTQTYGYDKLNRLSCVKEGSLSTPTWKQEFQYDSYGNRWIPPGGNTLPYTESITATVAADFDTNTNRLITQPTGGLANYDGTGNLKRLAGGAGASGPGTHDLSYDGENRIYESNRFGAITSYVYDGFGRRVKRSGSVPAYFAYDVSGNLLMEDSADVESTGVSYVTQDHLGSTRVVTDKDGIVVRRYDYAPFGEDLKLAGGRTIAQKYSGSDAELKDKVRFTGKERDAETGLDYFGARYMSAAQGRFTSPDAPFADQFTGDPQSWNLYGYVRNNPLKYTDPNGRLCIFGKIGNTCGKSEAVTSNVSFPEEPITNPSFYALASGINSAAPAVEIIGTATLVPVLAILQLETGLPLIELAISEGLGGENPKGQTSQQGTSNLFVPEGYWEKKQAPTQTTPGTSQLTDLKPSGRSSGEIYERTTHYDQYGRSTGQTHMTSHGEPQVHPNPHHHLRDPKTGSAVPPKIRPGLHPSFKSLVNRLGRK